MDAERSLVDYDAVNGLDQEDEEVVAEREMASTQAKRCGPGSKMSVPVYYIAEKTAHKRRAARFERHFQRAVKTVCVTPSSDPEEGERDLDVREPRKSPSRARSRPRHVAPDPSSQGEAGEHRQRGEPPQAAAAAYDAGRSTRRRGGRPADDFERDWPGSTPYTTEALPDDWKIVNLGAHFPEVDDEHTLASDGPETASVPPPRSASASGTMAN